VVLVSLALMPFFVTDRYRLHLVPALAVLAGLSLARSRGRCREGRVRIDFARADPRARGVIVFAPVRARDAQHGSWTFSADQAIRLLDRGAYPEAAEAFARAGARWAR